MSEQPCIVQCEPVLDISQVADLKTRLQEHIEADVAVVFEFSQVERVDTAALQLIASFAQQRRAQQRECRISDPSEAWTRTVALLGLGTQFAELFTTG